MLQQNQQNDFKSNVDLKDKKRLKQVILAKNLLFPLINQSKTSKNMNHNPERSTSLAKKIKISDIYYEQEPEVVINKNSQQKQQKFKQRQQRLKIILQRCCKTEQNYQSGTTESSRISDENYSFFQRKNSLKMTTKQLRPLKLNSYQKPQFFDMPNDKFQLKRYQSKQYLTQSQATLIAQKLSQPKCKLICGKRNCLCFQSESYINDKPISFPDYLRQNSQKLTINLSKLQQINKRSHSPINQGLRKILIKKNKRKNFHLKPRSDFSTIDARLQQSIQRDQQTQQFYPKPIKDQFSQKRIQQSSIKKVKKQLSKQTSQQMSQKIKFQVQLNQEKETLKTIQKKKPLQKRKFDILNLKQISYTFGQLNKQFEKEKDLSTIANSKISNKDKKYKLQQLQRKRLRFNDLTLNSQFSYYYDTKKKILYSQKLRNIQRKVTSTMSLYNQVVKQTIQINSPKKQDRTKIQDIPIKYDYKHKKETKQVQVQKPYQSMVVLSNSQINKPQKKIIKKPQIEHAQKQVINMFNRSYKSTQSSRLKKVFPLPCAQNFISYIKTYLPINPSIKLSELIMQSQFKIIPSQKKFFFGLTKEQSKQGFGIQITSTQIFQGIYQNDNRKQGFLKVYDGIYQGQFKANLRHGKGTFIWANGDIFQGSWVMGTKNGYGTWKARDGSIYEGQWSLNMQHGQGTYTHLTSTYEGQFKNFLKDGHGIQKFPNGDIFTGQYRQGKPNGKGKYQWTDGTYYQGIFVDGLKQGYGKWHQSFESFYEGQFLADFKHGRGIQYYKDGNYIEGQFRDGRIMNGRLFNSRKQLIQVIKKREQ